MRPWQPIQQISSFSSTFSRTPLRIAGTTIFRATIRSLVISLCLVTQKCPTTQSLLQIGSHNRCSLSLEKPKHCLTTRSLSKYIIIVKARIQESKKTRKQVRRRVTRRVEVFIRFCFPCSPKRSSVPLSESIVLAFSVHSLGAPSRIHALAWIRIIVSRFPLLGSIQP